MNENYQCTDCVLHEKPRHRCMVSEGKWDCRLAIFLDSPGLVEDKRGRSFSSDGAEFVKYCLHRMSIDPALVYFDYIVKCYAGKLPGQKGDRMQCVNACSQYRYAALASLQKLRAMVVLGSLGCETMTGVKEIGKRQGAEWEPVSMLMRKYIKHVWVGFSPGLLKEKPSEAGSIYRVIFKAAEEAGLNPHVAQIAPYEFAI